MKLGIMHLFPISLYLRKIFFSFLSVQQVLDLNYLRWIYIKVLDSAFVYCFFVLHFLLCKIIIVLSFAKFKAKYAQNHIKG